jgi:hypothetical protein
MVKTKRHLLWLVIAAAVLALTGYVGYIAGVNNSRCAGLDVVLQYPEQTTENTWTAENQGEFENLVNSEHDLPKVIQ